MNQRSRRANKGKGNKMDFISVNTGGHQSRMTPKTSDVQLPPFKVTGEIPEDELKGLAKASPNFKRIEPVNKISAEEQRKIIEEKAKSAKGSEDVDLDKLLEEEDD
jgi:hypothetical protein